MRLGRDSGVSNVDARVKPGHDEGWREAIPSGVAAILAEQVELLLHRTIREREQHGIRVGLVRDPLPARHHEQVAWSPFEGLIADPRATLAFDRREHGGIGRTIARGPETLRQ